MWRCRWTSLCWLFADMMIGPKTDENMIRTAFWFVEQDENQKDNEDQDAHLSAQGGAKEGDGQAGEEESDEDQRTLLQIHLQHFLLLLHKSLRLISDHRCRWAKTHWNFFRSFTLSTASCWLQLPLGKHLQIDWQIVINVKLQKRRLEYGKSCMDWKTPFTSDCW